MKAAVLTGPRQLEITELPVPEITDDQMLVRILVCGMCMSEYPHWDAGKQAEKRMGHEAVGIVEKVGSMVSGFRPGDRVTGMFFESFAEYAVISPELAVRMPDELEDVEGILEPWSCLVSGAQRIQLEYGASVALVGAGYMGLCFLQLMKLRGAGKIIAIDIREEGLAIARRFGANEAYRPDQVPSQYIVDEWKDDMFLRGVDVAVETGGNAAALELAGKMARPHGALAVVGFHQSGDGRREVDMHLWNWKALSVINAHERRMLTQTGYFRDILRLIQAGRLNVKEMATHSYPLGDINRAFAEMKSKPPGYIKGYVRVSD